MLATHRRRMAAFISTLALILAVSIGAAFSGSGPANAGPEVVGQPEPGGSRAIYASDSQITRIEYFPAGVKTMAGASTPVVSDPVCGLKGTLHRADVVLVGTMAGTAPTLTVKWQNSIDGTNWVDVGTWTTINATVTPASQSQVVGDIAGAATVVAYGDCWRASYTMGGTGTVTANISVKGIEK